MTEDPYRQSHEKFKLLNRSLTESTDIPRQSQWPAGCRQSPTALPNLTDKEILQFLAAQEFDLSSPNEPTGLLSMVDSKGTSFGIVPGPDALNLWTITEMRRPMPAGIMSSKASQE